MRLDDHVEKIRKQIDNAIRNRFGRMGISEIEIKKESVVSSEYLEDKNRIAEIYKVFIEETGSYELAYEKLVEEFTFTLFNRLASLKVMEAHGLNAEIVTKRSQNGDRSFAHLMWLETHTESRNFELEGLIEFFENKFSEIAIELPLFSLQYQYHILPTAVEFNTIIDSFNDIDIDSQVDDEIWKSDDILGWLYESYNNFKKAAHKESGLKTEYNKVSIQSQIYTPRWVVKFLVDNSLGKMYLEMFPDSDIVNKCKIANPPHSQQRDIKPIQDVKIIDPATGSGNFLLYSFDLFYNLYMDQIDNYGADYDVKKIPELIIHNNLYGIDLDDRAVQLAQMGLYIKVKIKNRSSKIQYYNIVSSDFYLPDYKDVKYLFEEKNLLDHGLDKIVLDIWGDLQQAHKFGSLIRLEEKFTSDLDRLESQFKEPQLTIFDQPARASYDNFRINFFESLQHAVTENVQKHGITFMATKTKDAITFLKILTQKYDIAVANPPYTDSGDFGPELKKFVDANYEKPYKFNSNLYATFIKRCYELTDEKGKMALIHPLTFMYIKSFIEVRKFILQNTQISLFVDYGPDSTNVFDGAFASAPSIYVLEKVKNTDSSLFISMNQYTRTPLEKYKKKFLLEALDDNIDNRINKHNYTIDQSKLKIIKGWPFIYWISDGFREKFKENSLNNICEIRAGIQTSCNERFLRFWWENNIDEISKNYNVDNKRWVKYSKGGPFNKWYGNLWLVIDWEDSGKKIQEFLYTKKQDLHAQNCYFLEGLTYSASGSRVSFRHLPVNHLFDIGGSSLFPIYDYKEIWYLNGFLNSKLNSYIINCLNPTVNIQPNDIKRVPFVTPIKELEANISCLASQNVKIKKQLNIYKIIETDFEKNPLIAFPEVSLRGRLLSYLNYENTKLTLILINEAIIDKLIFKVYNLSPEDEEQVETKMGKSVGELPVLEEARKAYLSVITIKNESVKEFIQKLASTAFEVQQIQSVKSEFISLYKSNNELENFCIRHQINPINVWYWFHESKILPQGRASEIVLEFLVDAFRTILMKDLEGIIPLEGLFGHPCLLDRLESYCLNQGFTSAQFMQMDSLLGRPIKEYIEQYFFEKFSDHLNLFMFLPKTPFIWHLSSGENKGFEAFIIIYKWNRDSLYKLKIQYLSKRKESLEYRQIQLGDSNTAQAQREKEIIILQLKEIDEFTKKVDELIAEGYNPQLDDGVGKNIAPLQNKGMLKADVLNKKQLEKYLKAEW